MAQSFRSYIPELTFHENKQEMPARCCHEDFVVIEPADKYRILLGRGLNVEASRSVVKVWKIPTSEIKWLEKTLFFHKRVLLNGENAPVLILGDFLDSTGLLFGVRPHMSMADLVSGLRYLGIRSVTLSPSIALPNATLPTEEIVTQISELFFYIDRIFDPINRFGVGAWTRTRLISNFMGCRIENVDMPIREPRFLNVEYDRFSAFLICAFLEMRRRDGIVSASGSDEHTAFRCRVELTPIGRLIRSVDAQGGAAPLLGVPVFRNFTLRTENGRLVLEALLQDLPKVQELHSAIPEYLCWRIELLAC